jgi:D-tyrosyl-tRNA(Tyr) deacylase
MRIVIQRVSHAQVTVDQQIVGKVANGFLVLLGVTTEDTEEDVIWLVNKLIGLRVFGDEEGKMNKDIIETAGKVLLISQFTLYASTKKGNRPSFIKAAPGQQAKELYEKFRIELQKKNVAVETGVFAADMKVELLNDGPVTIIIDSKNRE